MADSSIMSASDISFAKQHNGYDREQVDRYIENLSNAYRTAYNEYTAVCAKYNSLLEEYKQLSERLAEQPAERPESGSGKSNIEIIAKTLIDTEALAQKIIADAQAEADKLREQAQEEAEKTKDGAYQERATARMQTYKIVEDANAEAAAAREQAEKVLGGARAEAAVITAQARQNIDQANESILQLIEKLQEIVTPKTTEIQAAQAPEIQMENELTAGTDANSAALKKERDMEWL